MISQYFMRDRLPPFLLDKSGKLRSVDLPKRGNCYPFFGGTENSLSHVVAAQLIVELVSLIRNEHDPHLESGHLAVRLRFELT
jgi:hypothetical protein